MKPSVGARSSALKLLAWWMLPSLLFIGAYRFYFHSSTAGSISHLSLMATTTIATLAVVLAGASGFRRVDMASSTSRVERVIWVAGVTVTVIWIVFWCVVYLSMLVGLLAWGRVPTLSMIIAYADQLDAMLHVVGTSRVVAAAAAMGIVCIPLGAAYLATRSVWTALAAALAAQSRAGAQRLSPLIIWLLVSLLLLVCVERWYRIALEPADPGNDEPVRLMLGRGASNTLQSLILNGSGAQRRLDLEQAARAAYRPAVRPPDSQLPRPRNVVLITVDALRPDHLGVYGYARDTTPWLSAQKQAGRLWVVPEARSACAESACGLLSLTSGKQPHELLTKNFSLIDVLALHGYETTLLLAGDHTNFYGLRDSYGNVDHYLDGTSFPPGRMNDDYALLEQLRQQPPSPPGRPQFVFVHLMSAHGLGTKHDEHQRWQPAKSLYATITKPTTSDVIEPGRNAYDNGVRQADAVIRQLIDELTRRGVVNADSIVLLTGDHGESLGEHGIKTHAESVFESVIRVPWIWIGASAPHAQLQQPVIQADFAPTVLTALELPVPSHWSGIALQTAPPSRRTFHSQTPVAAVIDYVGSSRIKLIRDFRTGTASVFDLVADPHELAGRPAERSRPSDTAMIGALLKEGYGETTKK